MHIRRLHTLSRNNLDETGSGDILQPLWSTRWWSREGVEVENRKTGLVALEEFDIQRI